MHMNVPAWIRKRRSGSKCWRKLQFLGGTRSQTWHLQWLLRLVSGSQGFGRFHLSIPMDLQISLVSLVGKVVLEWCFGWGGSVASFLAISRWCASWTKFLTLVDIWQMCIRFPPRMSYHICCETQPICPPNLQGKSADVDCYSPHATASDRLASPTDLTTDSRWFDW